LCSCPDRERAMPAVSPPSLRNRLLASLSSSDLGLLQPHLEPVPLALRQDLEKPDKRVDAVYFPEGGFASVVAGHKSEAQVEVGLIGRDGMTGLTVALGNHRSPQSTYMQAAGHGQRITDRLRRRAAARHSPPRFVSGEAPPIHKNSRPAWEAATPAYSAACTSRRLPSTVVFRSAANALVSSAVSGL
jgi:hypothetical protein